VGIISQENEKEKSQIKSFSQFANNFKMGKLLGKSNVRKARGVGVTTIFLNLMAVGFTVKPLTRLLEERDMGGQKDVFYRFMNSVSANWYKFIRLLFSLVLTAILQTSGANGTFVLVLDDTLYKRNRSKNVELLTKIRDHNDGRYYRGFRCLTLGFHFGNTFLPANYRILSSQNKKSRFVEAASDIDKRSVGYKVRQYSMKSSFEMAFDMLQKQSSPARHVLFDSWFSQPMMFKALRGMDLHGVGMLKASKGVFCRFNGKTYNLANLYAQVKDFIHKDDDCVSVGVELLGGTPFSVTFVRDRANKRNWLAIGTTDMSLSGRQVIELYSRRWSIETFFKTVKSFLGFAKGCQSRSFDAVVCSVAVVFTRYLALAWINNGAPKQESFGQLFLKIFDQMHDLSFDEALSIVVMELKNTIVQLDISLDISVKHFFALLPCYFKHLQSLLYCET